MKTNVLYFGDNLHVLRNHIPDESVDLLYNDPPFNSARNYFVIFKDRTGKDSAAQDEAFADTWTWRPTDATRRNTTRYRRLRSTHLPETKVNVNCHTLFVRRIKRTYAT